ncbi:MAG: tail fiber domain-containing protein [Bacteroidota bacterium]
MKKSLLFSASLLLFLSYVTAQKIPFQGRLLDEGKPFNGLADFQFQISDPAWSESRTGVSVTDGYYAVVLGDITPLPDTLFSNAREVSLIITVNGVNLTPVTLHSPLRSFTGDVPVSIDSLRSKEIEIGGINGDQKVLISSSLSGYEGVIIIRDSLNNTGAFLQTIGDEATGHTNGYFQLNGRNSNQDLRSGVVASAAAQGRPGSFLSLFAQNSNTDGVSQLASLYASDIDFNGPIADGYTRGGVDFFNYYGANTHNIFSFQDGTISKSAINLSTSEQGTNVKSTLYLESGDSIKDARLELFGKDLSMGAFRMIQDNAGNDVDGANAEIELWGNESINMQLTANAFDDHDLPAFNFYGSIPNGGGFWYTTAQLNALKGSSAEEFGNFSLFNNVSGASFLTATLTGNLNESGAGGLELSNNNGNIGSIITGNGTADFFDNVGFPTINIVGELATIGLSTGNNDEQIDLRASGISAGSNSFVDGFNLNYDAINGPLLEFYNGGNLNIFLNGTNGDIAAEGQIFGTTLASLDGSVQTSDLRLKKNISSIDNSLENVLKMRAVSYQWKDENLSARKQIGVIAQEVEQIYPEFVHTDDEGQKAVNYAQMSSVLIEAIKELNAKIKALEKENEELKSSIKEVDDLKKQFAQLIESLGGKPAGK